MPRIPKPRIDVTNLPMNGAFPIRRAAPVGEDVSLKDFPGPMVWLKVTKVRKGIPAIKSPYGGGAVKKARGQFVSATFEVAIPSAEMYGSAGTYGTNAREVPLKDVPGGETPLVDLAGREFPADPGMSGPPKVSKDRYGRRSVVQTLVYDIPATATASLLLFDYGDRTQTRNPPAGSIYGATGFTAVSLG
ncbi:hypothetical protein [Actinoallomurus acanthiterrae]